VVGRERKKRTATRFTRLVTKSASCDAHRRPRCARSRVFVLVQSRSPAARRDETCPDSTGGGTRRVQLVREGGGRGGTRPAAAARPPPPGGSRARAPARSFRSPSPPPAARPRYGGHVTVMTVVTLRWSRCGGHVTVMTVVTLRWSRYGDDGGHVTVVTLRWSRYGGRVTVVALR